MKYIVKWRYINDIIHNEKIIDERDILTWFMSYIHFDASLKLKQIEYLYIEVYKE